MAISHRTVISFSLVSIPVGMYTATQDNDIHFNQLHREDGSRIKYTKKCAHCSKELAADDIVRGYEYSKDQYVVIADQEIEKIKSEKEKSIQILHFANLNQISPVFYEKTYQAIPEPGGEKAFELLRKSLMAEQKVAIGKTVLGSSDTLMVIIPREDGMLISTMFYQDEIKDLPKSYNQPEVSDQELNLARTIINSMDTPFNPTEYHNEFQAKMHQLVEDKAEKKEIVSAQPEGINNVISLEEALQRSVEKQRQARQQQEESKPTTRKSTRKKA